MTLIKAFGFAVVVFAALVALVLGLVWLSTVSTLAVLIFVGTVFFVELVWFGYVLFR